jgi:hypothetical protein
VLLCVVGWISPKQSEAEADNRMEQKDDDDDGRTPPIANSSPNLEAPTLPIPSRAQLTETRQAFLAFTTIHLASIGQSISFSMDLFALVGKALCSV